MTQPSALYTGPTAEDLDRIPADLKARPQWVLWRGEDRIDQQTGEVKLNKIPIDPQTLHNADTTDPTTWGTFEQCVSALPLALEEWEQDDPSASRGGGLGFVFTGDDPYAGIDLDHCVDPDTGAIADWAQAHIDALASYTEVTPSGTGLHTLVQGALPPRGRRKGGVEMYDYARFFTMTGWHLAETPTTIEARHEALTAFHASIFAPQQATRQDTPASGASVPLLEDTALLAKARAARQGSGARFSALWSGDWTGYDSPSNADLALCIRLAFWTQDPAQIDRLFRQSGLMRAKWDAKRGAQTYGERTIAEALARQTEHYRAPGEAQRRRNGSQGDTATSQMQDDTPLPYSDYTNALALVRDHGHDLHYCYPWGKWLRWTGTHWQTENDGAVMRSAKLTIKRLARQAEALDDDKAVKALLAHVKSSLATAKLKAMVESAQSEPSIPVLPEDLDTNPWLLNCTNGTLDLKTGILRPHDRTDLLTRSISVAYDPKAACPTWETFLWRIMGGTVTPDDPDMSMGELEARQHADIRARALIDFLQRAIGHSLTGDTREQCLFIFWGSGANGKSTLVNTLLALLGPYAMKATAELLMVTRNDRHPTERADLFGTRFVAAIETEEGGRLKEVFVKEATGGDPIRARRMREDFWQFDPTHKVFLATNHKPVIRGTDHAIWRRIKLVPFTVAIPDAEQDKQLPATLYGELPGILAWAVRGCLAWQQDGLEEPDPVTEATAGYRQEMDVLGAFFAECCILAPYAKVKASVLYKAYQDWCTTNGEHALVQRNFGMRLSERGLEHKREGTGYFWHGIGVYTDGENQ